MNTIGILAAFLGGILSLLSPCSALLLPAFFAYAFNGLHQLVARTALFYVGMCLTLVPLGAGLGAVGSFFDSIRDGVMLAAGIIIIVFGCMTIIGRGFSFAPAQRLIGKLRGTSYISVLLLGCVYGLASFCSGPILGSILAVAIAGGSSIYGALLMAIYALGMAAPLFLLAVLWDRFQLGSRSWLRGRNITLGKIHLNSISLISGLLFIGVGVLFLTTNGTASLSGLTDTETQFQAQLWATRLGNRTTNLTVVLVVLVLILLGLLFRIWRKRRGANPSPDTTYEQHNSATTDDSFDGKISEDTTSTNMPNSTSSSSTT